jgi:putative ABC transport system substrate-binding protein
MGIDIARRKIIAAIGSAAAWPLMAHAQQPTMSVIGFLSSRSPNESDGVVAAFRQGLGEAGFVEGKNVVIAFRWAEGRYERLPALAAQLLNERVAANLAAGGSPSALAVKATTSTIPIVFTAVPEPVQQGLVASFNRPGGNVTGMSVFSSEMWAKSVELLKELVPTATRMAYLVNPSSPSAEFFSKGAAAAASALGIEVHVLNASTEHGLDDAFASLAKLGAGGLVVPGEPFFDSQRERIVALAARYAIDAIAANRYQIASHFEENK